MTAADDEAAAWGRRIVSDLGGVCVEVAAAARPMYHAACALASNALVSLEETAAAAMRHAGVDEPRVVLGPLVTATAANWAASGPAAMSGPVVRGDRATVALHLDLLDGTARRFYETHVEVASP
jgi:predicted short-subunit dehydrogenase-like oxidoreductase (DUF2520 family)